MAFCRVYVCILCFQNAFYEKIYGKCLANESGGDLSANLLVECPEILLAREKQDAKKEAAKEETTPKSDKSQVGTVIIIDLVNSDTRLDTQLL